jgi:peptide/nickel transport system substrate-binding protein
MEEHPVSHERKVETVPLTRRQVLQGGLFLFGGLLLQACTGQAPPTPSAGVSAPAAAAPTVAPTVAAAAAKAAQPTVAVAAAAGELVPTLEMLGPSFPALQEIWRQVAPEMEKLGLKVNIQHVEANTWIQKTQVEHNFGDLTSTGPGITDDKMDPNWLLTELLHSKRAVPRGRNYGEWKNAEYDKLVDAQAAELDEAKRKDLVFKAQEIFARENPYIVDYYLNEVQAYNKDKWEGLIPRNSAGITRWHNIQSFINVKSKTGATVFKVQNDHDGNSTNPFVASGGLFNTATMTWFYDTLARLDKDLKIQPWAAQSWNWVDPTTIDVKLRPNMTWHDGKPVTAKDLAFTIAYAQQHKFPTWLPVVEVVDTATATDAGTVRFKLKNVFAPFVATILPFIYIVPEHIWTGVSDPQKFENPTPVGSGPYSFGHWRKNESWLYKRNPNHWSPPNVDVLATVNNSPESWLGQLEKGEIDATSISLRGDAQIDQMKSLKHIEVVTIPNATFNQIIFQTNKKPGSDPEFRRAFHHIVPKDRLIQVIGGKGGGVNGGSTFFPPDSPWHNPNLPKYDYNVEKARDILAKAGYTWDPQGRLRYPAGK